MSYVTRVILKDGRPGTVRESRTSIKHCKRNKLTLPIVLEDGKSEEIDARDINVILSSTL